MNIKTKEDETIGFVSPVFNNHTVLMGRGNNKGNGMNKVYFEKMYPEAVIPERKTKGAAGMDLCSSDYYELIPGKWQLVNTGLKVQIPEGYEGQIRPRSGLACNRGVTVLNAPGTIDNDYRGEIKVCLINHSPDIVSICLGDRIAQLVIAPVAFLDVEEVDMLDSTERGAGGFGSTGK
jgi:dUTP pyrophosphatase